MGIIDRDYAWILNNGQRAIIPNFHVGAVYPNTGQDPQPLLDQCLADPACVAVTYTGGNLQMEYGSGLGGWYDQSDAHTYALKRSRDVMCSDPNIPEPWKTYCLTNYCLSKDGMGKCDVLMKAYCDTDKGKLDKACSCINSPMAKTKYNPFCEDSNCITAGYPTQGMLTSLGTGCNIVDCSTALTLVNNGGIQLSDPTVTQRCGPGATTEATTSRQGLAGTWDKIKNANTMTKGIMVAALIAAVAVAVYMYRKK